MRPEYQTQIHANCSKKIEAIVRKAPKTKDPEAENEPLTPCPYCKNKLPETKVMCDKCKSTIPFFIATGRHLLKEDFTACPQYEFPKIATEFLRIIESEEVCPMCTEHVDPNMVSSSIGIHSFLDAQDTNVKKV
ncbi:WD repeat-containing protein 19-like isoform X1 [Athalia rosae]|uniref:WD repeat-containing protein 19-like isoform X1 n=1 Tax=Athalia rosae TaxID=37344 RepID=UPI002033D612|nr:WD repeat-containing protein 19-like isoform X1 [Athalia rosae]XP_048515491.1 WD repeat-containing protein 19-like isoform X1 [Athalia rosae]XP_048515492.1 WD repeat-containing protein 19-like isoform X1 [Athalia rosae]